MKNSKLKSNDIISQIDDSVSDAVFKFFEENGRYPEGEELDKIIDTEQSSQKD